MTLRTRSWLTVLISAIAVAVSLAGAQQPALLSVQDAPLGQIVPVDPLITVGTLPNGLRYYIRANKQPQARAELRLVVNAGSVLEDDGRRGLATSSSI
jgi:zinc protease